jgi:hypothetical protein
MDIVNNHQERLAETIARVARRQYREQQDDDEGYNLFQEMRAVQDDTFLGVS